MPFRFVDELSTADVAFEAWGATLVELFISAAAALLRTMTAAPEQVMRRVELTFRMEHEELGMRMVYDVAHNTAKLENHLIDGRMRQMLVHRKGATRSLGPGHPALPECYRATGQPVIIGGSMETGSYLLAGQAGAAQTFFTTAHGSGRTMSRHQAKKMVHGRKLLEEMAQRGIHVRTASYGGLAEEAGLAYKDIDVVAAATEAAGLSRRVVKLVPIGNIKG